MKLSFFLILIGMMSVSACQDSSEPNDLNPQNLSTIVIGQERFDAVWADLQSTPLPSDPFVLKGLSHDGLKLLIDVAYSGGCADHEFQLIWPDVITMIYPPRYTVILTHDANGDLCEAYPSKTLVFDLSDYDLGLTPQIVEEMELTIINGSNPDESLQLHQ